MPTANDFSVAFLPVSPFPSLADYYRSRFQIIPVELPGSALNRLVGAAGTLLPYIPGKPAMMRMDDGHLVSEEYCGKCHHDAPCIHTDALGLLVGEREYAEEQADRYAVLAGVG